MISDAFLMWFFLLPKAIIYAVGLIASSFPVAVSTAIYKVFHYAWTFNEFFPMGQLSSAIIIVLGTELVILQIKFYLFLYGILRGYRATGRGGL